MTTPFVPIHAGDKIFTILIVINDHAFFNTPDNHMMQRPRSIQPRASRHISPLTLSLLFISLFFLPPVHPDPVLLSFFLISYFYASLYLLSTTSPYFKA
jgi:hypothetical protein